MMTDAPAMSNTERQRKFRRANPGYYARIQSRYRAAAKVDSAKFIAALATAAMADSPVEAQSVQFTAEAPTSC
jgi:predicted LPLAT superfamily acyltransferase